MRIDINYKKEGFYQIFPILYIENDKEKCLVFGFGKKNISLVFGENPIQKPVIDDVLDYNAIGVNQSKKSYTLGLFGEKSKLTDNQKHMIIAVLGLTFVSVLYYMIRKRK